MKEKKMTDSQNTKDNNDQNNSSVIKEQKSAPVIPLIAFCSAILAPILTLITWKGFSNVSSVVDIPQPIALFLWFVGLITGIKVMWTKRPNYRFVSLGIAGFWIAIVWPVIVLLLYAGAMNNG